MTRLPRPPRPEPDRLTAGERVALVLYGLPTIGLLGQGLLYVSTRTFMPYHADALAVAWHELPPHHQGFVLGVIKGMGAGSIAVSVALLMMMAVPFRRHEPWTRWAIPAIGITFTLLTAYAAWTIDVSTPADTPWRQTLMLAGLYAAGGVFARRRRRDGA